MLNEIRKELQKNDQKSVGHFRQRSEFPKYNGQKKDQANAPKDPNNTTHNVSISELSKKSKDAGKHTARCKSGFRGSQTVQPPAGSATQNGAQTS